MDGDLVLISPVDRRCFALNGSAAAVWEALPAADEPAMPIDVILEQIALDFDTEGHPFADDVADLLRRMTDAGVVTESTAPDPHHRDQE